MALLVTGVMNLGAMAIITVPLPWSNWLRGQRLSPALQVLS
jgi:hypothetical protein